MTNPNHSLDPFVLDLFRQDLDQASIHDECLVSVLATEQVKKFEEEVRLFRVRAQQLGMFATAQFHEYADYENGERINIAFTRAPENIGKSVFRFVTNQFSDSDPELIRATDTLVIFGSEQPGPSDFTLAGINSEEGEYVVENPAKPLPAKMPPLVCRVANDGRRLKTGTEYKPPLPLIPQFKDPYDSLVRYTDLAARANRFLNLVHPYRTHVIGYKHENFNPMLPS